MSTENDSSFHEAPTLELTIASVADESVDRKEALKDIMEGHILPSDNFLVLADPTNEPDLLKDSDGNTSFSELAVADPNETTKHGHRQRISSVSDMDFGDIFALKVRWWDRKKKYSDMIQDGLKFKNVETSRIVMLFESPSSSTDGTSFFNSGAFKFHDWPPPKILGGKIILGPCRYASMSGPAYPVYMRQEVPSGLFEHWGEVLPGFQAPSVVHEITDDDTVYAYLPVESIKNHVNDPNVHFHLVGKDAIHLMTQKTTRLLDNTKEVRPCICKTTHSMGSKGIFIIFNDDDEAEFEKFLTESGNPTYVITDFVDIARNVACHFFIHPNGNVTWLGSNENVRKSDGKFSSDSYLIWDDQEHLKDIQLPFVEHVVQYCLQLGFWGLCGVDVLFDSQDNGFLVDVNPRVTGSCPALMTLQLLKEEFNFKYGLFRRSGNTTYFGSAEDLWAQVKQYNEEYNSLSRVVIHSYYEANPGVCKLNIGVYGHDMAKCEETLNVFAKHFKAFPKK